MTLKDLLKKKEKTHDGVAAPMVEPLKPMPEQGSPSEFTFYRSDTNTNELIRPPSFASDTPPLPTPPLPKDKDPRDSKRFSRIRGFSNASASSPPHSHSRKSSKGSITSEKRLSQRFHMRAGSRTSSYGSINVPVDLPDIADIAVHGEEKQALWEERATILAKENPHALPRDRQRESPSPEPQVQQHLMDKPKHVRKISDAKGDETIQEAIRLHEAGDLVNSTAMFGRLSSSNAMAQILYAMALRHGWGIEPNPTLAVQYLSQAASNTAGIESEALKSGVKKGGAAKGELVLAIYELANSFRWGWGVEKDPMAARKYYEVAANLGDTDAMNEVARCYEEGFGGKKDRYAAAQYYRLAEENGSKTLGNSWIWKDKYKPKSSDVS